MAEKKQSLARPQQSQAIRSPFALMSRMMEDMDRLFDEFTSGGGRAEIGGLWNPEIEVFQRDKNLVVRADLPGLSQDDVHVRVEGDELVIEGERKVEEEKEENGVFHSERSYGRFERHIPVPRGVDVSTCNAKFENGVLEINLMLPKESTREIPVSTGASARQPQPPKTTQNGPQAAQSRH
jgi:HSP20 family protein